MSKKLHVGNLGSAIGETSLREAFSGNGREVATVCIVMNRDRVSRGFAFVEMANDGDAAAAIAQLHGSELEGRELRVTVATEPKSRFGGKVGGN